ncbi:hypothetical protein B0H14DRAFT_2603769 [Mycena olivaceomarginata]|nr:hypothetical protein B0H14DRAFT_2603769 [Mycena olivaceomarginata]
MYSSTSTNCILTYDLSCATLRKLAMATLEDRERMVEALCGDVSVKMAPHRTENQIEATHETVDDFYAHMHGEAVERAWAPLMRMQEMPAGTRHSHITQAPSQGKAANFAKL